MAVYAVVPLCASACFVFLFFSFQFWFFILFFITKIVLCIWPIKKRGVVKPALKMKIA